MFQWNIQATLPKSLCFISHFQSQRSYETPPINDFLGIPYSVGHCTKSTWSFQSTSSKQHPWSLLPSFKVCSGCRPVSLTLFPRSGLLVHAGDRTSSGASWDPAPVWLSLCCLKLFFFWRGCVLSSVLFTVEGAAAVGLHSQMLVQCKELTECCNCCLLAHTTEHETWVTDSVLQSCHPT